MCMSLDDSAAGMCSLAGQVVLEEEEEGVVARGQGEFSVLRWGRVGSSGGTRGAGHVAPTPVPLPTLGRRYYYRARCAPSPPTCHHHTHTSPAYSGTQFVPREKL